MTVNGLSFPQHLLPSFKTVLIIQFLKLRSFCLGSNIRIRPFAALDHHQRICGIPGVFKDENTTDACTSAQAFQNFINPVLPVGRFEEIIRDKSGCLQNSITPPQGFLHVLALSDIYADSDHAGDIVFFIPIRNFCRHHPSGIPVGTGDRFFHVQNRIARIHDLMVTFPVKSGLSLCEEMIVCFAGDFAVLCADHVGKSLVCRQILQLPVFEINGGRNRVNETAQQGLLFSYLLSDPHTFSDIP